MFNFLSPKMDLPKLIRYYNYTSATFPTNTVRKNYFLAACLLLDKHCDVFETNLDCPFGGTIGIGNSKLHGVLKYLKIFRLHAIFHDAAGFMKREHGIGPGYCYMFSKCPINSCYLGHVTGIFYCVYLKFFSSFYFFVQC